MDGDKIGTADRRQLPVVFCAAPRCPHCGSANIQTRWSMKLEETSTRYVTCRDCQQPFRLVIE